MNSGITFKTNLDIMFGYNSFKDFISSVFGTWYKELVLLGAIIVGFCYYSTDVILSHINTVWFSPASAILLTITVIVVDWGVAVYGAIQSKTFETRKAQRLIPMLIINWLMLSGLYNIDRFLVAPLDMDLLSGSIHFLVLFAAFYLAAVHFVSTVVNAGKAGLINNTFVKFVMDYVDKKKQELDKLI